MSQTMMDVEGAGEDDPQTIGQVSPDKAMLTCLRHASHRSCVVIAAGYGVRRDQRGPGRE